MNSLYKVINSKGMILCFQLATNEQEAIKNAKLDGYFNAKKAIQLYEE